MSTKEKQNRLETMEGFADGAELSMLEAGDAWEAFTRQLTNQARNKLELSGYERGFELGEEYKRL